MLLFANKARAVLTAGVTSAAGQVAAVTTGSGSLFVGVGGVATSTTNPMRCVLTAVDANGNDTGAFEVVEIVRSGDNLTLQSRGLEGTSAAAWPNGTVIECRPTGGSLTVGRPRTLYQAVGVIGLAMPGAVTGLTADGNPIVFPAGFFLAGDQLRIACYVSKTGTSASPFPSLHIGDDANTPGTPASWNTNNISVTASATGWLHQMDIIFTSATQGMWSSVLVTSNSQNLGFGPSAPVAFYSAGKTFGILPAIWGTANTDTVSLNQIIITLTRAN